MITKWNAVMKYYLEWMLMISLLTDILVTRDER